jgi:hypothetical protein
MNIRNDGANAITPRVAGAWGMFSILRVLCGGAIVEDIGLYGRLYEQFHLMKPKVKPKNYSVLLATTAWLLMSRLVFF